VTTAEKYVTAAYLVFLGVVLLYVVIYSSKIARLEREVAELGQQPAAVEDAAETEAAHEKEQVAVT
jgi:type II secretory pathway component PulM